MSGQEAHAKNVIISVQKMFLPTQHLAESMLAQRISTLTPYTKAAASLCSRAFVCLTPTIPLLFWQKLHCLSQLQEEISPSSCRISATAKVQAWAGRNSNDSNLETPSSLANLSLSHQLCEIQQYQRNVQASNATQKKQSAKTGHPPKRFHIFHSPLRCTAQGMHWLLRASVKAPDTNVVA